MKNCNRLKIIRIAPEFISSLLTDGNEIHVRVTTGLPADAVIVGKGFDANRNCFYMTAQSETFPETVDGNPLEEFSAVLSKII